MGKYIRKSKTDGETIALMDVSSSSLGVLTRAKSLALQRRLQKPSSSSVPTSPLPSPPSQQRKRRADVGGSYLQLRSRRLQKKSPIVVIPSTKRRKQQRRKGTCARNPNPNPKNLDSQVASNRGLLVDGSRSDSVAESTVFGKEKVVSIGDKELNGEINKDPCLETSFGENFLELEGSERMTRESTPCSLIGKPETITSPGSATKLNECVSDSSKPKESLGTRSHVPTTNEMDEFFSGAEEEQQRQFIEKYNFDPVDEQPLPGRFEWKKVTAAQESATAEVEAVVEKCEICTSVCGPHVYRKGFGILIRVGIWFTVTKYHSLSNCQKLSTVAKEKLLRFLESVICFWYSFIGLSTKIKNFNHVFSSR